jgi:hypothetical protein
MNLLNVAIYALNVAMFAFLSGKYASAHEWVSAYGFGLLTVIYGYFAIAIAAGD